MVIPYIFLFFRDLVVSLVQRVIVLSQYNISIFVVVVRHLFVFERFKRVKYIQSETIYQINGHQYVIELESYIFYLQ